MTQFPLQAKPALSQLSCRKRSYSPTFSACILSVNVPLVGVYSLVTIGFPITAHRFGTTNLRLINAGRLHWFYPVAAFAQVSIESTRNLQAAVTASKRQLERVC
jgi:hypothetical protein